MKRKNTTYYTEDKSTGIKKFYSEKAFKSERKRRKKRQTILSIMAGTYILLNSFLFYNGYLSSSRLDDAIYELQNTHQPIEYNQEERSDYISKINIMVTDKDFRCALKLRRNKSFETLEKRLEKVNELNTKRSSYGVGGTLMLGLGVFLGIVAAGYLGPDEAIIQYRNGSKKTRLY